MNFTCMKKTWRRPESDQHLFPFLRREALQDKISLVERVPRKVNLSRQHLNRAQKNLEVDVRRSHPICRRWISAGDNRFKLVLALRIGDRFSPVLKMGIKWRGIRVPRVIVAPTVAGLPDFYARPFDHLAIIPGHHTT